ncbi:MAG: Crp/Fnr family transcriptional regulator [Bacteroidales bacterium]|nr:Crp/Fnr family transcriptional regulator [Bacteroidales bacterium]
MATDEISKNLIERQKELNCLYDVENLLKDFSLPVSEIMNKICSLVEKSMQHNDISRCQILINEDVYSYSTFNKTELKLFGKTIIDGTFVELDVYYIKPVKDERHPIFLPEEQNLVNNLVVKIASYINYRNLREKFEKNFNSKTIPLENEDSTTLINWLKQFSLESNEIDQILQKHIYFKKNETLCKQHTSANYLLLVAEGYVKLYLEHFIDHHFIFKIIKPFEIIGLSSIFDNSNYSFTATALTQAKVYLINKNLFKNLILHNNLFAQKVLFSYSENYTFILKRLNSIANKQALGKLADSLLYLSEKVFESTTIESIISRKDLAELSAISTENTVRLLSDLKNNQIIALNRNEIEIVNKTKLIKLSQHG